MSLLDNALAAIFAKRLVTIEKAVGEVSKQVGPRGETGPQGEVGLQGPQGDRGEQGASGERGPQGDQGQKGDRGTIGLPGMNGPKGDRGATGLRGDAGERGQQGEQGQQGETGPAPKHEWSGTKLRFQKPDGKWGKFTDLQGKPGDDGKTRVVVAGGGRSSGSMGSLLPGAPNTEPTGIAVVQGGQVVNLPWDAFITAISGAIDMGSEFSRRTDFVGDTVVYRGEAAPGASESAAVWRIKKIEFVTGADGKQDVNEKWAGGDAGFTNVWADRTVLGYA